MLNKVRFVNGVKFYDNRDISQGRKHLVLSIWKDHINLGYTNIILDYRNDRCMFDLEVYQ